MAEPVRRTYARFRWLNAILGRGNNCDVTQFKEKTMDLLMTIGIVLLVLWLLGLVTSYTLGGFIHILLVLAIIVILVRVIQGRRPIP
jgi:Family of unknown function (DUF5670)